MKLFDALLRNLLFRAVDSPSTFALKPTEVCHLSKFASKVDQVDKLPFSVGF